MSSTDFSPEKEFTLIKLFINQIKKYKADNNIKGERPEFWYIPPTDIMAACIEKHKKTIEKLAGVSLVLGTQDNLEQTRTVGEVTPEDYQKAIETEVEK